MNVREQRKLISDGIKNGTINEQSLKSRPSSMSRAIAYLNGDMCSKILGLNEIDWEEVADNLKGSSAGSMWEDKLGSESSSNSESGDGSEGSESESEGSESEGESGDGANGDEQESESSESEGASEGDSKSSSQIELPKPQGGGDDEKYVTTQGCKTAEEVQENLGLSQLVEDVNKKVDSVSEIASAMYKVVTDDIDLIQNKVDNMKSGGGDLEDVFVVDPKEIIVDGAKIKKVEGEHFHPKFETILKYAKWDKNVMLVGDAGTGKTTVAKQVSVALGLQFGCISCTAGMSESHLLGRMLFDGTYVPTEFVDCYENGGVFLLDEFDACDPNMLVVLNSALANGHMSVPNRKDNPTAKRHEDFICIVAGNTWGKGQGSRLYNGRNQIDSATLDRFSFIKFDYDKGLERKLSGDRVALYTALQTLRKRVLESNLQQVVSSRCFIKGQTHLAGGESVRDFLEMVTLPWTAEEKGKVSLEDIILKAEESEVK